jgi:TonB-dependent receptor
MNLQYKILCLAFLLVWIACSIPQAVYGQKQTSGEISGVVSDLSSKESLPYASVVIKGTVIGMTTDMDGNFRFSNLQAGDYILQVSYVGYGTKEVSVKLGAGEKKKLKIDLDQPLISIGEVVVSSQRLGQNAAINQQLNSNALVNVVSKDAIRELPDVNAAEAIGRLPGVSLMRNNGEGSKVVLRGLDPKFSTVSINGVKQPSTDMGINGDRSVDLSNISPELLSGIEVYKSPTADMDGDAIAGNINLVISKAPDGMKNQFRIYGGYNDLYQKLNNFKGSWDYSSRFFNKKFGIMAQANYEQIDRSAQSMDIGYFNPKADVPDSFFIDNVTLTEKKMLLKRLGGLALLDYQFNLGSVYLTTMYNASPRESYSQAQAINRNGQLTHAASVAESRTTSLNTTLGGALNLKRMKTDWSLTAVKTLGYNPYDMNLNFDLGAPYGLRPGAVGKNVLSPQFYSDSLVFNSINQRKDTISFLRDANWDPDTLKQTNYMAKVDFEVPLKIGNIIGGFLKFGGKYQTEKRYRSGYYIAQGQYYLKPQLSDLADQNDPRGKLKRTPAQTIQMSNFNGQESQSLLKGDNSLFPVIPESQIRNWYINHLKSPISGTSEFAFDPSNMEENYDTYETLAAGYVMLKLNYGDFLTLIPGVRYEYSDNTYHGIYSTINGAGGVNGYVEPDTSVQRYGEFLPGVHLKIKPTDWMDIRLSSVKTISRPNYMWLIPRFRYNSGNFSINKSNPDLKHATSWNYDASVTIYTGKIGLLSVGGYIKQIDNMFYRVSGTLRPEDAEKYRLPPQAFDLNEDYINLDDSYVKGIELEYKTHFNFLPDPFNRFVLGFNLTRLWSGTYYLVWKKVEGIVLYKDVRPIMSVDFNKSYYQKTEDRMPSQVDYTSNAWLGYDYKGFSTRLSMGYQGTRLLRIDPNSGDNGFKNYADQYLRFDLTAKQKINKYFSLLLNLNNITNAQEKGYRYTPDFPTYRNMYGFTAEFGLQVNFQ